MPHAASSWGLSKEVGQLRAEPTLQNSLSLLTWRMEVVIMLTSLGCCEHSMWYAYKCFVWCQPHVLLLLLSLSLLTLLCPNFFRTKKKLLSFFWVFWLLHSSRKKNHNSSANPWVGWVNICGPVRKLPLHHTPEYYNWILKNIVIHQKTKLG